MCGIDPLNLGVGEEVWLFVDAAVEFQAVVEPMREDDFYWKLFCYYGFTFFLPPRMSVPHARVEGEAIYIHYPYSKPPGVW